MDCGEWSHDAARDRSFGKEKSYLLQQCGILSFPNSGRDQRVFPYPSRIRRLTSRIKEPQNNALIIHMPDLMLFAYYESEETSKIVILSVNLLTGKEKLCTTYSR